MRAFLLLCLVASCDKWGNRLDKMEDWKDKICACPDAACAVTTENSYQAWWKDATRSDEVQGGKIAGGKVTFVRLPADKSERHDELRDAIRACVKRHTKK